jgi:hypothetical protein
VRPGFQFIIAFLGFEPFFKFLSKLKTKLKAVFQFRKTAGELTLTFICRANFAIIIVVSNCCKS